LDLAKKTKGKAKGPNKIPIANQNGLLAFRFTAIKYKRTPKPVKCGAYLTGTCPPLFSLEIALSVLKG